MSRLEIPVGLREDIRSVVIEYLSKKFSRQGFLFLLIQLAGIGLKRGEEITKEEGLKRLEEMRKKGLKRASR
ncbi:MAG: hypothetical protein FGF53_04500 [Candidatus Brockarchaeota archaeon]|nr:hypothetical protein [Candidatus Brockarchaeota archaeon]MBO3809444.1 hypothetical protein [Candidatus Brockarchaeota archaeon]